MEINENESLSKVLIVDDDGTNLFMMSSGLSRLNISADQASGGL